MLKDSGFKPKRQLDCIQGKMNVSKESNNPNIEA
jgi:hypothetical protein